MKDLKQYIKDNLRLVIDNPKDRVEIKLVIEDEVISSEFIDYSEVVRVVDKLNAETIH